MESEIAEIKEQLKDRDIPAEMRSVLEKALQKAESMLEKREYDQVGKKPAPAKNGTKKTGRSPLEDCQEILAKYHRQKTKGKQRVEKRKRQGKPPELTVTETVKKAAKSISKKVEKKEEKGKSITAVEAGAASEQIISIAKKILDGLSDKEEKLYFLSGILVELTLMRTGIKNSKSAKAQKGMHLEGSPAAKGNIRILHYKTENFDISPAAREYFIRIIANEDSIMRHKTLVVAMARDVDDLLGKVKQVDLTDRASKEEFVAATASLMRAMFYLSGIVQAIEGGVFGDPHKWYPGFLSHDLYVVANHMQQTERKVEIKEKGGKLFHSAQKAKDTKIFVIEEGKIVETTLYDHVVASADEVTSPRGIMTKIFVEEFQEPSGKLEDTTMWALNEWNGSKIKTLDVYDTEEEAEDEWFSRIYKYDFSRDDQRDTRFFHTMDEAQMQLEEDEKYKMKKGGEVKFQDKVDAVEQSLEGKPVPKKYQKESGKRYTKKTATAAARRIIGAQVTGRGERKGKRKMLLGGVTIQTPPTIGALADHNNLDVHNVGG